MKNLIIENMKRVLALLEEGDAKIYGVGYWNNGSRAELKRKMREIRRDTVALEKQMYDHTRVYNLKKDLEAKLKGENNVI